MGRVYLLLATALLLAGCTASGPQQEVEQGGTLEVPVGEDAWSNQVRVNISGEVDPESVTVAGDEMLVWDNRNGFPVTVQLENVEKEFTVQPGGTLAFKPAESFSYTVKHSNGTVGTGRVETG